MAKLTLYNYLKKRTEDSEKTPKKKSSSVKKGKPEVVSVLGVPVVVDHYDLPIDDTTYDDEHTPIEEDDDYGEYDGDYR